MRVDCRAYKSSLDKVRHLMEDQKQPTRTVAFVASATYVPAIAVCLYMSTYIYIGDIGLNTLYNDLIQFYGYTEVVPYV